MTEENVKTEKIIWAEGFVENIKNSPDKTVTVRDSRAITDIKDMLVSSCEMFADRTAFLEKNKALGKYEAISYKKVLEDVNALGTALIAAGFKGKKISVCGDNSYKWAVSYLSVVCGTGVVVPLDKELAANELKQLIIAGDISLVITDKRHLADFVKMKAEGETGLEAVISMEAEESSADAIAFRDMIEAGSNKMLAGDRSFVDADIDYEAMSIILFTSGTTGISKGVMLSHKNIVSNLMAMQTVIRIVPEDRFFSFLPLHHTYECTCGFLIPLYLGASIAYCEGLKYIVKNLSEAQPTVFLGVPAVFESLYKKIWAGVRKKGKEDALKRVLKINKKTKKIGIDISKPFIKDITALFGGKLRLMVCGGAAINPDILEGFKDFGLNAVQGYGLTEAAPIGALNPEIAAISSSIGRALPNCGIDVANKGDDGIGEIIIRGDNIMLGYYGRQDLTDEVIRDGWFYTGDLGYIDDQGYGYITGRKKNVIITKNGKNVYPEELEYYLSNVEIVQESMVWERATEDGEDSVIVASIKVDNDRLAELYPGKSFTDDELVKLLWDEVDKINEDVPFFKRIKAIVLRKEEFEKNSSKKIKRFSAENKQ